MPRKGRNPDVADLFLFVEEETPGIIRLAMVADYGVKANQFAGYFLAVRGAVVQVENAQLDGGAQLPLDPLDRLLHRDPLDRLAVDFGDLVTPANAGPIGRCAIKGCRDHELAGLCRNGDADAAKFILDAALELLQIRRRDVTAVRIELREHPLDGP